MVQIADKVTLLPAIIAAALTAGTHYGKSWSIKGYQALQLDYGSALVAADDDTDEINFSLQHAPSLVTSPASTPGPGRVNDYYSFRGDAPPPFESWACIPFTPSENCTVHEIGFYASRRGMLVGASGLPQDALVSISVYDDAAGSPGLAVGGRSKYARVNDLVSPSIGRCALEWDQNNPELTGGVTYWLAINFDLCLLNQPGQVRIYGEQVAGTSGCKVRTSAGTYVAIANLDMYFEINYLVYTDVPAAQAPTITVVAGDVINFNLVRADINGNMLGDYVRAKAVIDPGSTWVPLAILLVGASKTEPSTGGL